MKKILDRLIPIILGILVILISVKFYANDRKKLMQEKNSEINMNK